MNNNFITFGKPHYGDDEVSEVIDSLKKGWIGTGEKVKQFEINFANYLGVDEAVAVSSCSAALHLALLDSKISVGDEVITTAMTFCSTVNAIIHAGAKPILVDINSKDWNIDVDMIEQKISKNTKAILVVHFAGRPCNMIAIQEIAKKYNLILIEDCAHAIESQINGQRVGTFGNYAAFSFYSTKNISSGEGGVLISNSKKSIEDTRQRALHGMDKDAYKRYTAEGSAEYNLKFIGFKYNMMDLQAAIVIHQLKNIEIWHKRRKLIWQYFMDELGPLDIGLPSIVDDSHVHAYHLFQILVGEKSLEKNIRSKFRHKLHDLGIGSGIHYRAIPSFRIYTELFGWDSKHWQNAINFGDRTISVPFSQHLTDSEVDRVLEAIKKVCNDI